MRTSQRVILVLSILALTAGPALSATALVPREATITTPASGPSSGTALLKWLAYGAAAIGAIQIRDLGSLAKKYSTRAAGAQNDYKSGVESAGASWEQGATAGENNYEQGVQAAIGRKAFGKGIRAAGQQKYVANASKLGPQRYATGVQNAEGAWQAGFAPVAQVIQSLTLPPKGPKRSPQNQARANMVATALGAWKEGK